MSSILLAIDLPAALSSPSATKSTECKPTIESTVEAKPRSETAVEGEGAGSESTMEAEATTESTAEAKAASAKADCGKAVTARVRDAEGAPVGKGRRSERRTGCRNRQGGQTNRYLVHHDAHPFFRAPQPSFQNQTRSSWWGCSRAAQSRGVTGAKGRPFGPPLSFVSSAAQAGFNELWAAHSVKKACQVERNSQCRKCRLARCG
jgi:hypothetical protein